MVFTSESADSPDSEEIKAAREATAQREIERLARESLLTDEERLERTRLADERFRMALR